MSGVTGSHGSDEYACAAPACHRPQGGSWSRRALSKDRADLRGVFYGHADFGATTDTACSSGDQVAELDIILPPGVSLAVDAAHPISCLYADNDGPKANYPTCPTHTIAGAY